MVPPETPLYLGAAVRAARAAAVITGALVAVDSVAVLLEYSPRVARPRYSAAAWLLCGVIVAAIGVYLISNRALYFTDLSPVAGSAVAAIFWGGLAGAFTLRAIARAERPWFTFWSFALIMGFGTALAVQCPL